MEIKESVEEEIFDDEIIAKNLVKKFGEYDHTLELKNFKPQQLNS